MDKDTDIGGPRTRFPETRESILVGARSPDAEVRERAFGALVTAYWKPVYKYLRLKWGSSNEEAKDLTQGFFTVAFEKSFFARFDPEKARFRTFLRTCLDGFVANERKAAHRIKRGGGAFALSLDFPDAESEIQRLRADAAEEPEEFFRREWVRELFATAVSRLRDRCGETGKSVPFAVFRAYDLDGSDAAERPSYAGLATQFGIPVTQVTNHLSWARREFRRTLLDGLRAVTASEQEFEAEARQILGGDR